MSSAHRKHPDEGSKKHERGRFGDDFETGDVAADHAGTEIGALLHDTSRHAEAVQAELEMHAVSLLAAIDANIANDPAYFDLLKEAAGHMSMTATALSGGIAANAGIE